MRYLTLILLILPIHIIAQQDSARLSIETYLDIVKRYHPAVLQGDQTIQLAQGDLLSARGAFDIKLDTDWDNKGFKSQNYYSELNTALKIPTWIGADIKVGYERNRGIFLNPRDNLPSDGLLFAGVSIPVGSGRAWDERRAIVRAAELNNSIAQEDRIQIFNELYLKSIIAYLEWSFAYRTLTIQQEGVRLAEQRLAITKSSFIQGDKPAIDTLEASILLQKRAIDLNNTTQFYTSAKLELQNFLWGPNLLPIELSNNAIPENIDPQWLAQAIASIPENTASWLNDQYIIKILDLEKSIIDNDRRLARESLKPNINIEYFPLLSVNTESLIASPNIGDYKIGLSASIPIQTRKGRGKLLSLDAKTTIIDTKISKEKTQLTNIVAALKTNRQNQLTQIINYQNILQDQLKLVNAERRKFQIGESSVFLVNSRESKYLTDLMNVAKSEIELLKMRTYTLFYTGLLWNRI